MDAVLFNQTAMGAANTTGTWSQVDSQREYVPVSVNISVGTATVQLMGRINGGDTEFVIKEFTTSESLLVAAFPQMRVKVTAVASGPTVRVSMGARVVASGIA